jgi:hypothetical protein
MSPLGTIHLAAALLALASGAVVLLRPKGTGGHRAVGLGLRRRDARHQPDGAGDLPAARPLRAVPRGGDREPRDHGHRRRGDPAPRRPARGRAGTTSG